MPGIPCIYYGSEWGTKAENKDGDPPLRPCFDKPQENEVTELIRKPAKAHRECKALCYGDLKLPVLTNKQCIIQRDYEGERVFVAINADSEPFTAHFDAGYGLADDLGKH